jgi:hypothetical protein
MLDGLTQNDDLGCEICAGRALCLLFSLVDFTQTEHFSVDAAALAKACLEIRRQFECQ